MAGKYAGLKSSDIELEAAQRAVAAAIKKAEELGCKSNIAVVDAGTNLKAFARMEGAWLGSIDISIKKARTARAAGRSIHTLRRGSACGWSTGARFGAGGEVVVQAFDFVDTGIAERALLEFRKPMNPNISSCGDLSYGA